jgi:hypothetical protein
MAQGPHLLTLIRYYRRDRLPVLRGNFVDRVGLAQFARRGFRRQMFCAFWLAAVGDPKPLLRTG